MLVFNILILPFINSVFADDPIIGPTIKPHRPFVPPYYNILHVIHDEDNGLITVYSEDFSY